MNAGTVRQVGTPAEIYEHPADPFIAQFVGGATLLRGTLDSSARRFMGDAIDLDLPASFHGMNGGMSTLAIKPEAVRLVGDSERKDFHGVVRASEYLGYTTHILLETKGVKIRVTIPTSEVPAGIAVGDTVGARIDWTRCSVFSERE